MQCDRKVTDLSEAELTAIESRLGKSGIPFLQPDEHFKAIVLADEAALKKHNIDLPKLIGTVDNILSAAHKTVRAYRDDTHTVKLGGVIQFHNDQVDSLKRVLENIPSFTSKETNEGVTVVNCGGPADHTIWEGPNPFSIVPMNAQWSCWSRMQAPVVFEDRMYLVATITWGGAELCPFQHPEDKKYHGYEYGSQDHVIISPCLNCEEPIMLLSDLSLHMARAHGFCGGKSPYRIDPIKLANMLGCGPDVKPNPPGMVEVCKETLANLKKEQPAKKAKKNEGSGNAITEELAADLSTQIVLGES